MHEMIKKWGRERFSISWNYSCTISLMVNILLVKLKNLESWKNKIVTKMWGLKGR